MSPRIIRPPLSGRDRRHSGYVEERSPRRGPSRQNPLCETLFRAKDPRENFSFHWGSTAMFNVSRSTGLYALLFCSGLLLTSQAYAFAAFENPRCQQRIPHFPGSGFGRIGAYLSPLLDVIALPRWCPVVMTSPAPRPSASWSSWTPEGEARKDIVSMARKLKQLAGLMRKIVAY